MVSLTAMPWIDYFGFMIKTLDQWAILLEQTYVFENSFEDAKSLILTIRPHVCIHAHTLYWKATNAKGRSPLLSHQVIHVSVGRCQSFSPGTSSHTQAIWINVSPSLKPIPLLLNILIFSHAHTHHTLHGVSACRPSFSLFLYWSLCPHSWCQSHF